MDDLQSNVNAADFGGHGEPGLAVHEDMDLTLTSDPAAVRMTLRRLMDRLMRHGVDSDTAGRAELLLAEVLNNVVEHALFGSRGGMIRLSAGQSNGGLAFEVSDEGAEMPGGELPDGAAPAPTTEDLPEGGFGWLLIRKLASDIRYERVGDRNVLRFSMGLAESAGSDQGCNL